MASRRDNSKPQRPPATTLEGRENQLIAAAYELAERQILEGKASSQVITHFLKLGTTRERLEQERLTHENALLIAKADSIASQAKMEDLYSEALKAMRTYQGRSPEDDVEN